MKYKLYLDDVRPIPEGWIGMRCFHSFTLFIKDHGLPQEISFDHDLGVIEDTMDLALNGYDCARWLLDKYQDETNNIKIHVHSANPVGRERIINLFRDYRSERARELRRM